jgi:transcriptional regulator of arginine metabolism
MEPSDGRGHPHASTRATRVARQSQIRELVGRDRVANQRQLADLLAARGFEVTQATVSRDIAELGLVKVVRGDGHAYAAPADLAVPPQRDDSMVRRVLRDVPVEVRRSGLILLLVSTPGTASILAEAIDRAGFSEPAGTLAGDNTVLVLFGDEPGLGNWRDSFLRLQADVARDDERDGGQG